MLHASCLLATPMKTTDERARDGVVVVAENHWVATRVEVPAEHGASRVDR
jgi:hypothetical protein